MKKFYARRLLSLLLVVMLVFPVMSFASGNDDVKIKSVYFQDEGGNMVFVDYEEAISKYMNGETDFYLAIKDHVGKAEAKGRPLYLGTSNGRFLNYGMAMKDNVFMLKAILETSKYDMQGEIKFTHELKLVDGEAKIVPYEKPVDPDPEPEVVDIVDIVTVSGITVELGTPEPAAMALLAPETKILDSEGTIHIVTLNWDIQDYDEDSEGEYNAIGSFELPENVENGQGLDLHVKAIVKVVAPKVEDWPKEVEDVFVGESQITGQFYANIRIKSEYVSLVKEVYIDNNLGNQMEDQGSQWRVIVADGTSIEDLRGKIRVESEEEEPIEEIHIEFKKDVLLGEGFGLGNLLADPEFAKDYPAATQYAVLYSVGNSEEILVVSDRVNLGEYSEELVQYVEDMNVISIFLYDIDGDVIKLIEDVMVKK